MMRVTRRLVWKWMTSFVPVEVSVKDERSHVNAEAGNQAQGIHVSQNPLTALGDEDDAREENGVHDMNTVQGLAAIRGNDPVETVPVSCPLHEFAGSNEGSIHRHGQGKARQSCDGYPEGTPFTRVAK